MVSTNIIDLSTSTYELKKSIIKNLMKHFVAMLHDDRFENSFVNFLAVSLQTETALKAS